jgi:hypothetical protein
MISARDEPIIRRALMRRLDAEPGVRVLEIHIFDHQRYVAVGLLLHVDDKIIVKSLFDLEPKGFNAEDGHLYELKDIHNQADEIAEQCKEARKTLRFTGSGSLVGAVSQIHVAKGTGRRGHWRNHH